MRTTVTLDPDVVAGLRRLERECGLSFKQALNAAVRAGLRTSDPPVARLYEPETFHAPLRPGVDLRAVNRLLEAAEDAELARKIELGK